MSSLADPAFLGVLQAIDQARQDGPLQEEIDEDIESEQQTLPAVSFRELQIAVQEASKGVSEGTDGEYRRCVPLIYEPCSLLINHGLLQVVEGLQLLSSAQQSYQGYRGLLFLDPQSKRSGNDRCLDNGQVRGVFFFRFQLHLKQHQQNSDATLSILMALQSLIHKIGQVSRMARRCELQQRTDLDV